MKCLVLGGGGFIGSHVCDALLSAGYGVRIFEKERVSKENVEHLLKRIEWIEGDFTNKVQLEEIVKGVDVIVHAIATTLPKTSNENPVYDIESNLVSTLHLLEAAKTEKVKKVVFFSSGGTVYGIPQKTPIAEDHPTEPICSYGIQKLAIEKYLNLYRYLYAIDYAVMRIANPYGERQRPLATQGSVIVFLYKAMRGEQIEVWGDGSVVRDFLHVTDVARAVVKLIEYNGNHRIFNVGGGTGYSLLTVLKEIERVIGREPDVRFSQARPFDVPVNVLDITRAKTELGWVPEVGFEEGLKRTMAFLSKY